MKILDTLFLAGADMGLYTSSDHSTPLHCLARTARESSESYSFLLYSFITHLVRDLRAPLDARDSRGETCMHIAAEHGHHIIVLMAFLDCDVNESVAKTRNSRGLTPFEVAKPEFRVAFGDDDVDIRPASCASMRTIKPRISSTSVSTSDSLSTTPKTQSSIRRTHGRRSPSIDVLSLPSDPSSSVQVILDTFHAIAEDLCEPISLDINLAVLDGMLQESSSLWSMVLTHYRDRLDDELDELRDAQRIYGKLDTLLGMLEELVRKRIRHASRQSSSSSASLASKSSVSSFASMTLVNSSDGSGRSRSSTLSSYASLSPTPSRTTADSPVVSGFTKGSPASSKVNLNYSGRKKGMWPSWLKPFTQKSSLDAPSTYLGGAVHVEHAEIDERPPPLPEKDRSLPVSSLKKPYKLKSFSKVLRKEKLQSAPASQEIFGSQLFLPNLGFHSEESCGSSVASSICDFYVDSPSSPPSAWGRYNQRSAGDSAALQASLDLLDAARRDASRLDGLMAAVEQAITSAYGTLSEAETLMRRVLASNQHALQGAKLSRALADLQDLAESRDSLYSVRSITPDLFTFPSPPQFEHLPAHTPITILTPSPPSFSPIHSDEEQVETLSRLLVQKLPAQVDKVFEDVEKATVWLGIIRETTRTVQKQVKL
ncbi:hypothetical protein BD410DRAFT_595050 [Rickenella mellea]|uniref:Uncharacterized protein n=1 Tax=Rickenella mellea TaxID=50990 RepID=A0A4Y7QDM5_9AGAM|nr:hypothetical protein BD410DRAFT_595050 [Rickenella mellea]